MIRRTLPSRALAVGFAVLLSALALTPALGAGRHARKGREAALGKKKEAGLDESLKAKLERQKSEEAREARPVLQFEQFRRGVELQVAEKRHEQIETLRKIVELGSGGPDAADLLFRLAELYWEEAQYYFFLANQKDDEIIAAKGDQRAIARLKREQARLNDESRRYRRKAVERYRQIVKEYRSYPRLDEVLYSLGSNLWEDGEREAALKPYKALVQHFKKSEYVPDAYLAFGEYFFDQGEIRKALKAYQRAAKFTESKVYGFALYKQGWCYYNLGEYEQALDTFKAVVFYGDLATTVAGQNKIALVREARRDYVLAYSQVGDPKAARDAFKEVGGEEHLRKMLHALAGLYYDTGKDREAIYIYRLLIKEQPLHPDSPGYQARIVDAAQRLGNKRFTVKQVRLLVRLFKEVEKSGVVKTKKEKEKLEEARAFAERTIRTLAVTWHSEAKKTRDEEVYFLAHELYRDYLRLFPNTKYEYEMRFYFGELLYYLEKYADAAEQYTRALQIDIERIEGKRKDAKGRPEKPGKFLVDAAFNAVLAYETVARAFEESEKRPQVPATQAIPIPPPKQALLEACERYLKYVPKGEKKVEVTYKVANIYYRYNHFDEAVQRFAWVALEHPEHELAEYAANLVLDSYVLLDQPAKVNAWARRFLKNGRLAKGKYRDDLLRVLEDSALTMVERSSKAGKHEEAARAYEGFVKEFPHSKKADRALFNASVSWANAHRLDRALALRARIIKDYPDSDLVPEAIFTTAKGYESFAAFDKAARFYELYASRFREQREGPKKSRKGRRGKRRRGRHAGKSKAAKKGGGRYEEGKAQEALFNAAVLREGLGDFAKARADRMAYVALWPKAKDAKTLFLSIADLYEWEGNLRGAVEQLQAYVDRYARGDVDTQLVMHLRMARLWEKSRKARDRARASAHYNAIRQIRAQLKKKHRLSRLKAGLEAIATVELMDLGSVRQSYDAVRLEYPWTEKKSPKALFAFIQGIDKAAARIRTERQLARLKRKIKQTTEALKRGVARSDAAFKKSVRRKADELKKVVDAYMRVVKYKQGGPALCALEKIGDVYADYATSLKKAPLPPYLQNEDQALQFRDNLSQEILPVEDKAVEAWSTAVTKSHELHLYTPCARRAKKKLRRLRPDAMPVIEEEVPKVRLAYRPTPRGVGLLDAIQPIPKPAKARRHEEAEVRARLPGEPDTGPAPDDADSAGEPKAPPAERSLDEIYADPDEDLLP